MTGEHKIKVLMVDDEKFLLSIYKIHFEKEGYEVSTYHDVDNALSALREGLEPDVILFDITMPDSRSGYEFIESVKHEALARHSLKIALTNEGQEGAMARMRELGTNGNILKASFLPSEIVTKVAEMLKEKKKTWQ